MKKDRPNSLDYMSVGDVVILTPTAYQIELGGFGVKNFVIELRTDEAEYYGEFSL